MDLVAFDCHVKLFAVILVIYKKSFDFGFDLFLKLVSEHCISFLKSFIISKKKLFADLESNSKPRAQPSPILKLF